MCDDDFVSTCLRDFPFSPSQLPYVYILSLSLSLSFSLSYVSWLLPASVLTLTTDRTSHRYPRWRKKCTEPQWPELRPLPSPTWPRPCHTHSSSSHNNNNNNIRNSHKKSIVLYSFSLCAVYSRISFAKGVIICKLQKPHHPFYIFIFELYSKFVFISDEMFNLKFFVCHYKSTTNILPIFCFMSIMLYITCTHYGNMQHHF